MSVTSPPAVDALPTAPSTTAPSTFSGLADAFIAALAAFRTQLNALASNVYGNATDAASSASSAATNASTATAQAAAASASAATAVNAPGTNATSTTSDTIAAGATTITIQTGKAYVPGMFVMQASSASPANYMFGQITAYNSGTGQLDLNVSVVGGSGTFASWTVSLATPRVTPPAAGITLNYSLYGGL